MIQVGDIKKRERQKRYEARSPERVKLLAAARQRRYRAKNPERVKELHKVHNARWYQKRKDMGNPPRRGKQWYAT